MKICVLIVKSSQSVRKENLNVAKWTPDSGWEWILDPNPLERRDDWSGVEVVGAVHPFPPLTITISNDEGEVAGKKKVFYESRSNNC